MNKNCTRNMEKECLQRLEALGFHVITPYMINV